MEASWILILKNIMWMKSSKKTWRIQIGTWMFYVPFLMILGAPVIIPLLGFSATKAAAIVGGILIAGEVIWFASIPLLGKEGFKQMKSEAFSLLKPKSGPISQSRHKFGVWMFTVGALGQILLAMGVMVAYFMVGAGDPDIPVMGLSFEQQAIAYVVIQFAAIGCIMVSVYVLGADFWERLNGAFEWQKS
jgi:hypothetical protein